MRTPIETLSEDEFLRDLVRFHRSALRSSVSRRVLVFGWRFHGAFTDMLIFFKSLCVCVCVCVCLYSNQQIAHLQTIPEKQRLVPDGSCACLILSIFLKALSLSLSFHLLLEMNEIMGAVDHRSAEGRSISMARARGFARFVWRERPPRFVFRLPRILSLSLSPIAR
jgi:hypothetical protein